MAIRILGTGSCLAEKEVSNDELAKYVDTSDEWISSRTGIKNRRIAVKETTTSMAAEAAERALEMAGEVRRECGAYSACHSHSGLLHTKRGRVRFRRL